MGNKILALFLVLLAATVLADELPCPVLEGANARTVDGKGRNVTIFAAGYYERPDKPPKTEGAKWIPGGGTNLCSVSTFSGLSVSESEDREGGGDDEDGSRGGIEDDNGNEASQLAAMGDCLALHDWASAHPGHWVIPQRNLPMAPLLVLGSCAVTAGVRREWRSGLPWGVAVSTEDVERVMREVLEKFVDGGSVGGRGRDGLSRVGEVGGCCCAGGLEGWGVGGGGLRIRGFLFPV